MHVYKLNLKTFPTNLFWFSILIGNVKFRLVFTRLSFFRHYTKAIPPSRMNLYACIQKKKRFCNITGMFRFSGHIWIKCYNQERINARVLHPPHTQRHAHTFGISCPWRQILWNFVGCNCTTPFYKRKLQRKTYLVIHRMTIILDEKYYTLLNLNWTKKPCEKMIGMNPGARCGDFVNVPRKSVQ